MTHARRRGHHRSEDDERASEVTLRPRTADESAVVGTDRRAIFALQRAAGNRAVAQHLARRRVAEPEQEDVSGVAGSFGATRAPTAPPTLFGRADAKERRGEVQRYITSDSVLTNVASGVGLGAGVGAMMGAVTFESSGFSATVGKALAITKDASDLTIDSQPYQATGTVKATGPKARVGNYEIGFLQTVYRSDRNFYYEPDGHSPGLLARVLPTVFGERKKISDTCSTLPVRDGDAGKVPWYGTETVDQFDVAATSTKTSTMGDTPGTFNPWTVGTGATQQHLVKTDGKDRFRSWLAVKDKASLTVIPLNYADWEADYSTTVTFNKAAPASSTVTPTGTSGSKVLGQGNGSGGQTPLHGDPVANDVATTVNSTW